MRWRIGYSIGRILIKELSRCDLVDKGKKQWSEDTTLGCDEEACIVDGEYIEGKNTHSAQM